MVTSKILNPERLKEIKRNGETLALRLNVDHFQVPFQLLYPHKPLIASKTKNH